MDRLKLNTKALLGMATRTVDQDHGLRHTCVKVLYHAVLQYETAMSKFATALSALSDSLEGVENGYKSVISNEKNVSVFDAMKEVTGHLENCRVTIIPESIEALKVDVAPSLSSLKEYCDACERLHSERTRAVDLYDYHRNVVEKKEVNYASKGKLLDDSKHYKEELTKRDAAHDAYLAKHNEYNEAYDEIMCKKSELTTLSGRLFLRELLNLLDNLKGEVLCMCNIVDNIPLNQVSDERGCVLVAEELSYGTNVMGDAPNGVSTENNEADAVVAQEPTDEQLPAAVCEESKDNGDSTPELVEG
ncbi:hypothetical protein TraAM80_08672 [Trypanosoma rangeli]|uniref:BAR domain-containing protein n=1 Tax=Trypanosoma rangeli TaxID=5698 RepID=A0A422MZP2_TRYRA|nr:uncharacterized protein TraAM80_08672 [Trypanosoma rangeli]RNE98706.1 hypothetical protein TraAM80_08672 [Trypanosoma rangeli]|eukprot:RNE98706.1 hypothetical protein TraAM80_08672 [Trypanosoma rangeli]